MSVFRMMRVQEPSGINAWVTATRSDDEFGPEVDELIEDLAPHLRSALCTYVTLERERLAGLISRQAVERMNYGWLTLDNRGCIVDTDIRAAKMLEDGQIIKRGTADLLTSCESSVAFQIANAVNVLVGDRNARPRAIVLCQDPWFDMLLVPANVQVMRTRPAPTLIAYVHADNWSSADRCEQLGQLFDLTPSEARLALALSRGMSISDAATNLGLTIETVRSYSKRIYGKTGARGQADLVRFIHRSVLAIA